MTPMQRSENSKEVQQQTPQHPTKQANLPKSPRRAID